MEFIINNTYGSDGRIYGSRRVTGVPSGLQNRYEQQPARVGSIPTYSRHVCRSEILVSSEHETSLIIGVFRVFKDKITGLTGAFWRQILKDDFRNFLRKWLFTGLSLTPFLLFFSFFEFVFLGWLFTGHSKDVHRPFNAWNVHLIAKLFIEQKGNGNIKNTP